MNQRSVGNAVVLFVWLSLFAARPSWAQNLRIYVIDVEQGASTLLVAPSGQTLLVDSGKNGHGGRVKAVMDDAGVSRVDFFVATHYHEDHYGGIDDLVEDEHVVVGQAFDRGDKSSLPPSTLNQGTYKDYQRAVGSNATHITRGMTIPLDPSMVVTCLASGSAVIGEQNVTLGNEENDFSVALLIVYSGFRFFVGGDIEEHTEEKIAARDLATGVDLYQANHHGSHSSSSHDFVEDMAPTIVVISNGNTKAYRHPRQVTLDTFAHLAHPAVVFQTNKYLAGGNDWGNVPDAFIADPETTDGDGTILITVPSSGDYTVSYGVGTTHAFHRKGTGIVPAVAVSRVVIASLVPNPAGPDRDQESVTLRNGTSQPVSVVGWVLRDRDGFVWSLSSLGTIAAGASEAIDRNGMALSLNNDGDEIALIDDAGTEHDRFSYSASSEGASIQTGH